MSETGTPAGSLPAIALVVCTRNRAARLPALFAALASLQTDMLWELVLVDSASTDETPEVLAEQAQHHPHPFKTVRVERQGLARARNAGYATASAPLVVFIDDDCYPEPDLLDRWLEVYADGRVGFGGGRILLHDPNDAPVTIRTDLEPWLFEPGDYVRPGVVQGANMAVRRTVLDELGGFCDALGPGTPFNFEDVDLAARASAAGHAGGYFPGPVVRHHHGRRRGAELNALLESYDVGRGAYWGSLLLRPGYRWFAVKNVLVSVLRKPWSAVGRELRGMVAWLRSDGCDSD